MRIIYVCYPHIANAREKKTATPENIPETAEVKGLIFYFRRKSLETNGGGLTDWRLRDVTPPELAFYDILPDLDMDDLLGAALAIPAKKAAKSKCVVAR